VLEGSVRKSGDRIRITTQLVDARSDTHLWSEQYDRKLDDLFEVQDDIARQVVVQLKLKLLEAVPKARRVNPQAYLSYVQARQLLEQSGDGATIDTLLRQAIELDPTYAQAWTGFYWLYFMCQNVNADEEAERVPAAQRDRFCARLDAQEAERLGVEALDRALALDPQNATAIAYQALADPDFESAGRKFEQAAKLDPTNPDVLRPIMFYTQVTRRPDLTVRIGEFVAERDPDCARAWISWHGLRERGAARAGSHDASHQQPAAAHPGADPAAARRRAGGARHRAETRFIETESDQAWALHLESMALYSLGRTEESTAALAQLESLGAQYANLISPTYAWRGDMANAVRWLERHFEARRTARMPVSSSTLFCNPCCVTREFTPAATARPGARATRENQVRSDVAGREVTHHALDDARCRMVATSRRPCARGRCQHRGDGTCAGYRARPGHRHGDANPKAGFRLPESDRLVTQDLFQHSVSSSAETALNTLPQFVPAYGSSSNNPSNGGQGNVQLRGLGSASTLVLIDGKRLIPANGTGVVDVNVIPVSLIESVEIITARVRRVRLGRDCRRRQLPAPGSV
jgi:tetratricopeptide (TPR) repeat protein